MPYRSTKPKTEQGVTRNEIISMLTKSPHGELSEYVPVSNQAIATSPEFFAHLIAWNQVKGQIRDSKVALPVIALAAKQQESDYTENALAHLALLNPRDLLRAVRFAKSLNHGTKAVRRLVERYLTSKESASNLARWDRLAIQHRSSLKELYALLHIKPSDRANDILFRGLYPAGSLFEAVRNLQHMTATEAAGTIMNRRIPFLIASGALGARLKDQDVVLALIKAMSATELVTNTKMLDKLGVQTVPALRAAYAEAMEKARTSKKQTFKATRAAEAIEAADAVDEDGNAHPLAEKLRDLQERQISNMGGIEGNWGILADSSPSMIQSIEVAKEVAGVLSRAAKGNVYLVFFDSKPRFMDVTGKTYEEIKESTKLVKAGGSGTSIGCGLQALKERGLEIDGLTIVSDGEENSLPYFANAYAAYTKHFDKELPVYFYVTAGGQNLLSGNMKVNGIDATEFNLTRGVDYHSLPNLIQTMRVNKYSLVDEIMEFPLLTVEKVLGADKTAAAK